MGALVDDLARTDFAKRHPGATLGPIVVLIAAYLEAESIGDVIAAVPSEVHGIAVSTLVVVDGGTDGTDEVAERAGAFVCRLPVNRGQGAALRLGYDLAISHGARFVVTVDADGQNDPSEIPGLVEPLVTGEADFVVASRRLGVDHTTDRVRRAGVFVYGTLISRIAGIHLTDTSNGFRALTAEVLGNVTLEQDQYQTAELIISAARRGYRITERPTAWHPRAAGTSKKGGNLTFGAAYLRVILRTWLRERRHVRASA